MNDLRHSPLSTRSFRRDKFYWFVTVLCFAIAIGYGIYWHQNPEEIPPPNIDSSSADPRIMVLAFDRITNEQREGYVNSALLRDYLNALSSSGFQPITVQSLHDFYYSDGKLPDKPVLLTFDYGHLDTYIAAHPVLVETGWRAAISITTNKQLSQNTHYLYWDRLQRMLNSGYWEILTHGNKSDELIPINSNGDTAPFITSPKWLIDLGRQENAHEFSTRLATDIRSSSSIIKDKLDTDVLAYVFRYGLPEQIYQNVDTLKLERQIRNKITSLAFVDDEFGVNDIRSNPHDLRRLRVDSSWGAFDLMTRMYVSLTFPETGQTLVPRSKHWISVEGNAKIESDNITVKGTPRSLTWLGGSQWQDNWIYSATIRLHEGDFWLFQSNRQGIEWRFGGNRQGLFLKTVNQNETTNLLQKSNITIDDQWHKIMIVRRGSGVWITWDDKPLWDKPVRLPDNIRGPVGLLTWNDNGNSQLEVQNTNIASIHYHSQIIAGFPSANEIQQLALKQDSLAALSPVQFTLDQNQLREHELDSDLFSLLQHRYAWQVAPTIVFTEEPGNSSIIENVFTSVLTRATMENWGGIHLDLSALDRSKQKKLDKLLAKFNQKFRQQYRNLLVSQVAGQPPLAFHSYSNNLYAIADN